MDLPQEMLATSHAAEGTEQNANIDEASAVNRCNRKRRPKIHPIWKNFKEVRKPLGRILVCKTCAGELGIRSTTTVLKNHWNTKHKDEPLSSIETSILSQESNIRATNINKAFINVLAIPSISINSFLHSDMREFLSLLNPSFQVPKSHTTLRNMLVKECDLAQIALKRFIKSAKNRPSLICDIWSNSGNTEGYLGATLTVCDNSSLRYIFLGAKSLYGPHTAYLIRKETELILANYDLNLGDIVKIVTDSGANIVAAFKDMLDDINDDDEEAEYDNDGSADFGDIGLSEQGVKAIRYLLGEMNIQLKMIYNSDAEDYNPIYLIAAALDPNTIGILSDIDLNTAAEWICKMLPSEQLMQEVPSVLNHESLSVLDSILQK